MATYPKDLPRPCRQPLEEQAARRKPAVRPRTTTSWPPSPISRRRRR